MNLIFTVGMIAGHVGLNCETNVCTNSNPWGTYTPAYCISDQNNLHRHLHCRQDILQRNFSFQHNLHLKTQVLDFHIIHFLKSRARRLISDFLIWCVFHSLLKRLSSFLITPVKQNLEHSFSSLSSELHSPDSTISVKKLMMKLLKLRLRHDHQTSICWLEWDDPYICALSPANSSVCSLRK